MIFDAIAAEPGMLAAVDRLTSAGRVELLAADVSIRQVAATPDLEHRARLRRVRVLVVPPPAPGDDEAERLRIGLARTPGVGEDDALVALAARAAEVPLVTEDRALRRAVESWLPQVGLWRWAPDLRPRLVRAASG